MTPSESPAAGWTVLAAQPSPPGRPAAIGRRLGARVLDLGVWAAVLYALDRAPYPLVWQLLWSAAWLVLPRGRTLGKRLFGVRVVRAGGSPLRLGRALGRELVALGSIAIPIVGVLTVLTAVNDPRRQALHDKAADTMALGIPR